MAIQRLSVDVHDLRLPVKDGIRAASELGFQDVELAAAAGEITPAQLSDSGRRHVRRLVTGAGLGISSLTADVPGTRLTDPRTVDERVARTCEIIDLAKDLGVTVVTAAAGALTHPETGEPSSLSLEALQRIGEIADSRGIVYAIRPSYDSPDRLANLLAALRCPAIRIGIDPAAMVMAGTNPLSAIERLADSLSLFHIRDGAAGMADRPGREMALGEGEVDLVGLVELLESTAFNGPYVLRRIESTNPLQDIQRAKAYLQRELER